MNTRFWQITLGIVAWCICVVLFALVPGCLRQQEADPFVVVYQKGEVSISTIPREFVKVTPRTLAEVQTNQTVFVSPGLVELDKTGRAWLWMNGNVTEDSGKYTLRVTKTGDGWMVTIPKGFDHQWRMGEKEKWTTMKYEPVKLLIVE